MSYLRLFLALFRINVLGELAYRINFVVQVFQSLVALGTALGGLAVVFAYTSTLGGWRPDEVLALVGVYLLVGGVIGFVIQPGMAQAGSYSSDCTDDYWQNTSCWTPNGTPITTDLVHANPVTGANTLLKIDAFTDHADADVVTIDYAAPAASVTLQQAGGILATNYEHVGEWGAGAFTQAGGTNTITGVLYRGDQSTGNGTYTT